MNEPVIEVVGLRCRYGRFEAVRGIDFAVQPGELFALLGTNGAGKTTTMEVLEGLRAPSAGSVRVLGLDPAADRARVRPRTGVMLQESGFPGDLTVREAVTLWRGLTSRPSQVDESLAMVDLAHRRDVRVKALSGGERRRLDLALATLGRPDVLFLDEPTTGLDPESRARTWRTLRDLLAHGTSIVLTTHYLEEAENLAHRIAIMHEGRIEVCGPLADVLEREASRISFTRPDEVAFLDLPGVAGRVDPEAFGKGRVEIRTRVLQDDLAEVLRWAADRDIQLGRLRAHHASLADVFHGVSHHAAVAA
ncbi:ABC-2 type transport system ATP-binding protein [Actinokineospora alba]|uniref:ABC-2 type transport system ATP-binding protein n=1 Tax=Actinokineospora alba TaxID=504798 RepID=A0A1H0R4W8_9PSEU|nr:ABC transporter ATP-binding protein [Actinokineospora alba]TDP70252.1 ABC-2 type transport system ATP-binding protein [Actinokineospora alba]SDI35726.1 ABC-2 type transport system ATP-binding protein [Actinokineospora alba]SDP24455.1 ABC-2 type transport system ATP-binding protein [Actinokineospora alba]